MSTLKEYMAESGRSLTDLAADCGTSPGYMHDLINGRRTPSLSLALTIVKQSGGAVDIATLIGGGNG